jgi:hypothetical protein
MKARSAPAGAILGQAALKTPREANGPHMPDDHIGLSYEVQQLVRPVFRLS